MHMYAQPEVSVECLLLSLCKFCYLCMCMSAPVCVYVHTCVGAHRVQKRALNSLDSELPNMGPGT